MSPAAADGGGWAAAMAGHIQAQRGHVIKNTGRRIVATFDGPARAIRCAATGRDAAAGRGIEVRAGIHTGEVEILGDVVAGVCVGMTEDLAGLARPAEILVTRTVQDLVVGSGIAFADRGSRRIGAAPGRWRLFTVTGP